VGEAKIEFGTKPDFDVNQVYARVTGGNGGAAQIALLPAALGNITFKNLNDWRDKSVLIFDSKNVSRVSLQAPAIQAVFERDEKNQLDESAAWKISSPLKALADAAQIGLFLQQLPQIKITKFLEETPRDEARWGLKTPTFKLELTTAKGRSTLRVGKPVAGGFAAQNSSSPAVFVLPSQLFGIMSRPLVVWRDKSVLKLNTGRLKTLNVAARGQQMEFEQSQGKWLRPDGQSAEKFSIAALEIGFVLQKLTASSFIDNPKTPSTYGLDKPTLTFQLTSDEWSGQREIQFAARNGKTYARVLGQSDFSPTILVLPADALDGFKISLNVLFGDPKK